MAQKKVTIEVDSSGITCRTPGSPPDHCQVSSGDTVKWESDDGGRPFAVVFQPHDTPFVGGKHVFHNGDADGVIDPGAANPQYKYFVSSGGKDKDPFIDVS